MSRHGSRSVLNGLALVLLAHRSMAMLLQRVLDVERQRARAELEEGQAQASELATLQAKYGQALQLLADNGIECGLD